MVHSLKKAKTWLKNYDCIVTYGDIIYTSKAIRNLMHSKSKISVLFDKNWKSLWKKRFKNPLSDAETFMYDNKKNLQEIGLKTKNYKNIQGQFMGIIKFKPSGWKKFDKNLQKYFKKNHKIFTTDVLNSLIKNEKFKIKAINYDDKWSEIDNKNDIKTTHKIFK